MKTGRPVESEVSQAMRAGEQIELWPSQWGAKNWPHAAFNPNTGLLYANTMHHSRLVQVRARPNTRSASATQGFENLPVPNRPPASRSATSTRSIRSPASTKWRTPIMDIPYYSAMLATAGGLLFTGKSTGEFIAVDMDTGKIAVAVQDELGHQRAADHLHAQGQAIRRDPVGPRRRERRAWARRSRTCRAAARSGRSR